MVVTVSMNTPKANERNAQACRISMQQMLTQCEIQMHEFASLPCNLAEVFPQKHGKFYCKFTLRQAAYSTNLGFYEQDLLIFPWYVTPQLPVPFINYRSHFVVFFFVESCVCGIQMMAFVYKLTSFLGCIQLCW